MPRQRLTPLNINCCVCGQPAFGKPAKHPKGETGWMQPVCRNGCLRGYQFLTKLITVTTYRVVKPGNAPSAN